MIITPPLFFCGTVSAQVSEKNLEKARELFISGTSLQMQGNRHAEAILEFQESLRYDTSEVTLGAIARSYLELRKLDRALEYATLATEADSTSANSWEILAEVLVSGGRYDDGVKAFEKVRGLTPSKRQLYTLGKLYEPRSASKAIEVFEEIVSNEPDLGVYRILADLYLRTKNAKGQLGALQRAYDYESNNPVVLTDYVVALLDNGRIDTALVLAKTFISMSYYSEVSTRVWLTVLNKLYSDSLLAFVYKDSSLACLDYSALHFSNHWQITTMAGSLALMLNDQERASLLYQLAIKSNPTDPDLRVNISGLCIENTAYDYAIKLLKQSITIFPRHARFPLLLGWCYQLTLNPGLALVNYNLALKIDPMLFEAWVRVGNIYDSEDRHVEADSAFAKALEIEPDDALVCNNYAYSLSVQGRNLDQARMLSWKALQQYPTNPSYLDTYAWILFKLGDYNAAQKFIERAVQYDGNATHYDHLGDILEKQGDLDGAVRAWAKSLQLDSSKREIQTKLDRYR
ncbi:MAG: tetratricopeptide repeat protein [Ignavibacteria bacterium]|nr:tetratricopeptide repeat protein [Ignavibacteria bacterium]